MAQPGEARATPANARVGTIQRWIVGVAIGCSVIGVIAFVVAQLQVHAWRQPEPRPASLSILYGIEELFFALACLAFFAGRGALMYLHPHDVRGQLRDAVERTGHPRLYGVVMIWVATSFVLGFGIMKVQTIQVSLLDNAAVSDVAFALLYGSVVPLLLLEVYGWWRHRGAAQTP